MVREHVLNRRRLVAAKLIDVFQILALQSALHYVHRNEVDVFISGKRCLLHITPDTITTPVSSITEDIFAEPGSSLIDQFVTTSDLSTLMRLLNEHERVKILDHIGFCYLVKSQENELNRIKRALRGHAIHGYTMDSDDYSKWYFIGDLRDWRDPMIELLPTLPNNDSELAYWMPHIHIDINTSWSAHELEKIITSVFGTTRRPVRRSDQWGVHSVRLWLGVVAGVNIHLDIATTIRNLHWVRTHLYRPLP